MTETNIGIDISKDHLDVHRLPGNERRRFDNSKAGHKALIQGNSDLAQRFAILCSIPGIAEVSAAMLLIEMPELGSLDEKQVAALAGLAPIARQSGNWKGKSFIRGGRQQVRQGLYMPALVAIRFNADLKTKYEQLIKAGKAPKQAITAVMRKLIILANALLKKGRNWQPRVA